VRIISFCWEHFAVQVEAKRRTETAGQPVIIGGRPKERRLVFDASEEAASFGVKPGMSLRQAYSLCPEGIFLPPTEKDYAAAFAQILDLLNNFSAKVEAPSFGLAFIESPFERGEPEYVNDIRQTITAQSQLVASVGCASNKFVAQVASIVAAPAGVIIVSSGEERNFLANLPINFLPGSTEVLRRLKLLGLRRMKQVASLPREAMGLQFGREGERLWDLANGLDETRLIARQREPVLQDKLSFDPPAETLDRLLSGADALLRRLAAQLNAQWQYCQRLTAHLCLTKGSIEDIIDLKHPTASPEDMLRHLRHRWDNAPFSSPITSIKLTLSDMCAEKGLQPNLFVNRAKRSNQLLAAIKRLQAKYGHPVIKKVTHAKSNSRLPEHTFSLTDFS
jgi:nucleotidyltransferase/DNA polymerase involved in DNA repair